MAAEHQKPLGSGFDKNSTAADVIAGVDLSGKTAVVTGGYSGIGIETTKALAGAGANVIVPVRDKQKADEMLAGEGLAVKTVPMDLGDLASVTRAANDIGDDYDKIHLLINNAGIMACPMTRVGEGWEAQFAVNHIGHFVFTRELAPYLANAGGSRVVCLSSLAHRRSSILWDDINYETRDYDKWEAYGQSKTANALFALELNRRRADDGVNAFSVHPGGIMTPLQRHMEEAEKIAMGWIDENGEVPDAAKDFFKTPEQGAATTVWCAVSDKLEARGGEYCEDCDIAQLVDDKSPDFRGVRSWACDEEAAERLWDITNEMILRA